MQADEEAPHITNKVYPVDNDTSGLQAGTSGLENPVYEDEDAILSEGNTKL